MRFGVLGPMQVTVEDQIEPVGSRLQRTLLASLLISANSVVPVDRLVENLWGPDGWDRGPQRLWFHISKLRSRLDGTAALDRFATGYILRVDESLVDSMELERLAQLASDLVNRRAGHALVVVDRALGLWRGNPYEDVPETDMIVAEQVRLTHCRLTLHELRNDIDLAFGRGAKIVPTLEQLVVEHPFRDRFRMQLLQALWQDDRVAEARAVFEDACRFADAELMGGMSPELERVAEAINTGRSPFPSASGGGWPGHGDDRRPTIRGPSGRLPNPGTPFLGRSVSQGSLESLIETHRLVTLVGPAGVGKTRLAVETALGLSDRFDRVFFIDLAQTTDPKHVHVIAATAVTPNAKPNMSAAELVLSVLSRGTSIVVIDNCEHVIDGAADLVTLLLTACDGARLVATSRERLRIGDEQVMVVDPLEPEPGAELLVARSTLDASSVGTEDHALAAEICRRLDGLPLAIELAAQRLTGLSLADLLAGLDNRFELLTAGDRSGPDRQQTLRTALDWSFESLPPEHKRIFNSCSRFAGRFTLDDIVAVHRGHDRPEVGVVVADLVDRNLLHYADDAAPYRLLETMRAYGRDHLAASDVEESSGRRHAEHFADKVLRLRDRSFGTDENETVDAVMAQTADYRLAIDWTLHNRQWGLLADLATGLAATVFWLRGAWIEPFVRLADVALAVPEPMPQRWPVLVAACTAPRWNSQRVEEAERSARLAMSLGPTEPHGWIQGAYSARPIDRSLAHARAVEAVNLCDGGRPSDLLPALLALCLTSAEDADVVVAENAGRRLVAESARIGSLTGRCAGELGLAGIMPPGSPQAAAHAKRAMELARTSRTRMMLVTSTVSYIEHVQSFDRARAEGALRDLLLDRAAMSEVLYIHMAIAVCARLHARTGSHELAVKLGREVPDTVLRRRRSAPEVEVLQRALASERFPEAEPRQDMDHDQLIELAIASLPAG